MQIVTSDDVVDSINAWCSDRYAPVISGLEKGMAIKLSTNEWNKKTPINYYFLGKYNRNGKKVVSVRKVGPKDYLVIKL